MPGESLIDPNDLAGSLQKAYDRLAALEKTGVLPVGLIGWFPAAIPDGWLGPCDGSAYDTTRYGQLFAYLASSNLPDIDGRVVVGKAAAGTFAVLNSTGGVETVTLTAAQSGLPLHSHVTNNVVFPTGSGGDLGGAGTYNAANVGSTSVGGTPAASSHPNLQPYIVLLPAIKF